MARRIKKTALSRSFQNVFKTMTRTAMRAGTKVIKESLRAAPLAAKRKPAKKAMAPSANWMSGMAIGAAGPRRYWLYKPPGVRRNERRPLLVMLHGCGGNYRRNWMIHSQKKLSSTVIMSPGFTRAD